MVINHLFIARMLGHLLWFWSSSRSPRNSWCRSILDDRRRSWYERWHYVFPFNEFPFSFYSQFSHDSLQKAWPRYLLCHYYLSPAFSCWTVWNSIRNRFLSQKFWAATIISRLPIASLEICALLLNPISSRSLSQNLIFDKRYRFAQSRSVFSVEFLSAIAYRR